MSDKCPKCGALYAMVGRAHRCVPRMAEPALPVGVPKKRPRAPPKAFQETVVAAPVGKRGRPRIEDRDKTLAATKPWLAAGMSQRTWYRRQRERAETKS
jgi:hypothetical protein